MAAQDRHKKKTHTWKLFLLSFPLLFLPFPIVDLAFNPVNLLSSSRQLERVKKLRGEPKVAMESFLLFWESILTPALGVNFDSGSWKTEGKDPL